MEPVVGNAPTSEIYRTPALLLSYTGMVWRQRKELHFRKITLQVIGSCYSPTLPMVATPRVALESDDYQSSVLLLNYAAVGGAREG